MKLWKITCDEKSYPGQWRRWFKSQCVGVGWWSGWGFRLEGPTETTHGWGRGRAALRAIEKGDTVIVALRGHCVGRIGVVVDLAIGDDEWDPLVPPAPGLEKGEMGRRIRVRWELAAGPDDPDSVVQLPEHLRLTSGELRPTIAAVRSRTLGQLRRAMKDPGNWVSLRPHFAFERALSEYIAAYPHHLGDDLVPHPSERIRERVLRGRSRIDVLLQDEKNRAVVVECKQAQPTKDNLTQIRSYMKRLQAETKRQPRGILVHGGARTLSPRIRRAANRTPRVEIVHYKLDVVFSRSI